jgi:hypothetical protein
VVLTSGWPVVLTGTRPDSLTMQQLTSAEPCLSSRSIVIFNNTAYYASPNGIASVGANGLDRPTNVLLIKEDWVKLHPENFVAAIHGSHYIAFFDASNGLAIALPPYEPVSLVRLDRYDRVSGVETDVRSGDLMVITGDAVWKFDAVASARFATTWRSKQFVLAAPTNFGAYQIIFDRGALTEQIIKLVDAMSVYNAAVFDTVRPLNVLNGEVLNKVVPYTVPADIGIAPPQSPQGGQAMYDIAAMLAQIGVRFTLMADGAVIYTRLITDETVHKLPSGMKYTKVYFELASAVDVQRVIVAETARECRSA